ncbi:MAG: hypothetical protein Q8Q89_01015 [bacterium]|nr:hypothetical protein [bacterium]
MGTLSKVVVVLIFTLAGVLFFHNLTSINADIGRHIGLGEIIWQSGEVPKTNLLSFTAPDHPFINHHWLSEVIFYGVYSTGDDWLSGLRSVIIFKIIILLVTYFLLFLAVKRYSIFSVVLAFLVSIFVFSVRTEPRPEIFSYLIFAAYLLVIYKARKTDLKSSTSQVKDSRLAMLGLWLLPILQIFWVNLHIYFIIGPIIYFFFLIEKAILSKINRQNLLVGLSIVLANFVNPNFIAGALYPFKVLNNYGYSVAENSSLFFLAKYFGHWAPQDKLFLVSVFILVGSFIFSFWKNKLEIKTRVFDLLLTVTMVTLSFKMQRNIPLFALSLWPVLAGNLSEIFNKFFSMTKPSRILDKIGTIFNLKKLLSFLFILILVGSIYFVVSGRFYNWLNSSKMFGLEVSSAAQDGTDFIKTNKIQGPVFNNFDIGSYLVWQLYPAPSCSADRHSERGRAWCGTSPDQKVFVDGRPEAYPVEFFDKIYKPMQRDEKIWQEMSEKYGINYIFFAHTDMTEWAEEFLARISKDREWPMVFLNDAVVVFLKNIEMNQPVTGEYQITEQNITEKLSQVLDKLNKKDDNAFINFGNALYRFRWLDASAKVYEALIANQPNNSHGYQGAGYAYATMNDPATQEKAAQNLKKAIDLGFESFNNYFTLGIINANLGNFIEAKENIKKALEVNPDSPNARQMLEAINRKMH